MGSLKNLASAKNWKYALREITLIVAGILIALAINNWNENRLRYNEETQTLKELSVALNNDLTDIKRNASFHNMALQSSRIILDHIRQNLAYHDSLDAHFGQMMGATFFLSDDLVYNTLAEMGRDMISSDSIRTNLSLLYAHDYPYIKQLEEIDNIMINDFFRPYYSRYFNDHALFVSSTPRDYNRLIQDPYYEGNLEWWISNKKITVPLYEQLQVKVERILGMLERELANR